MFQRCVYLYWFGLFLLFSIRIANAQVPQEDFAQDSSAPEVTRLPPVDVPFDERMKSVEMPSIVDDETLDPSVPSANVAWYQPTGWFLRKHWKVGLEFGINGAEGNTDAMSFRVGTNAKRETDHRILALNAYYANGEVNSVVTKSQGLFTTRDDWLFSDSRWTLFTKSGLEFDRFRAFDLRLNAAAGSGYRVLKSEQTTLIGRAGSGVSREFGGPEDNYVPEADCGIDFSHRLSKLQTLTANVDYFPAWTNFNDYRIVSNAGWEIVLDTEMNLSLKLSIIDRYDSTPNSRQHNDLDYSLLLIWTL